ncbi:hypothetical protein J7T55_003883 [Diaporthe amygdali]|uniref:uncharacterized protein n=1 Tax=Phomopsis amygdali TaxID=1214568 RepID=UPI0022FE4580|nr:uncharacterized protein J7T55_003883 [Diaporthe amygdali]KAJ0117467.1 hypothetical protein J7T55_003883 [Diaporthe amygdali]
MTESRARRRGRRQAHHGHQNQSGQLGDSTTYSDLLPTTISQNPEKISQTLVFYSSTSTASNVAPRGTSSDEKELASRLKDTALYHAALRPHKDQATSTNEVEEQDEMAEVNKKGMQQSNTDGKMTDSIKAESKETENPIASVGTNRNCAVTIWSIPDGSTESMILEAIAEHKPGKVLACDVYVIPGPNNVPPAMSVASVRFMRPEAATRLVQIGNKPDQGIYVKGKRAKITLAHRPQPAYLKEPASRVVIFRGPRAIVNPIALRKLWGFKEQTETINVGKVEKGMCQIEWRFCSYAYNAEPAFCVFDDLYGRQATLQFLFPDPASAALLCLNSDTGTTTSLVLWTWPRMKSWHERDCRRPDVVLMENNPTCLSCGSLFIHNEDEAQGQLSKHTPAVDKASSRLTLDWPSSITFSSPDDVTDPGVRRIHTNLDQEIVKGSGTSEMTPSKYEPFTEHDLTTRTEVGYSVGTGLLTDHAVTSVYGTQKSTKKLDPYAASRIQMQSMNPDAVYHSLMGTDEIRLLHLDSYDTVAQPLHGFLRPTKLSHRPDYIALSYTWADADGDRTLRERIFLGSAWTPFAITRNCAAALRRLRSRGGTRTVWIDAICIDQANTGERSHQVSLMRDIYSRAESVAIFLGGDTGHDTSSPSAQLMQRLSDDRFRAGKAVKYDWGGEFDFHSVLDLFRRPYWSRIWVIQEVLLARRADLIFGSASIPFHEFTENFMKRLPEAAKDLLPLWVYSHGTSPFGDVAAFSDLLNKTSTCKASDERDMVFALFGLMQGASLEGLIADYTKTLSEIYIGLAAYFLIRHGQSGLLKAAACAAFSTQIRDQDDIHAPDRQLPSWIPFGRALSLHETELFQDRKPPTLNRWRAILAACGRRPGRMEYHHLTVIHPRSYEPSQAPLNTFRVFDDNWIIEVPGCDELLHLTPSGRAPGTYEIASLSSVLLVTRSRRPVQSDLTEQNGSLSEEPPSRDYRLWMPLMSFGLQELLFLSTWDSTTQMDKLIAPRAPGVGDSLIDLSQTILMEYSRWLETRFTPPTGDDWLGKFDAVVRTVSMYLERWEDLDLWSRMYRLVVALSWSEKLKELARIKADVWHYLTQRERWTDSHDETEDLMRWELRLCQLFDDIVGRLVDIPLETNEGEKCLGHFMSTKTCSLLRNSINNIPDTWSVEDIQAKEATIFEDWTGVESCWEFMEQSTIVCYDLRIKFVQLRTLKRLFGSEHRDFLIS